MDSAPAADSRSAHHDVDMSEAAGNGTFDYLHHETGLEQPAENMEDDLYADMLALPSEPEPAKTTAAPVENLDDDLYGDMAMDMDSAAPEANRTADVDDFSLDNLTPESIAQLLKSPEKLQPLLEKHPQLLQFLQQSLGA